LIGTLPHGFYDEISLGADFYTGHLVAEIPGEHKVTDLAEVDPVLTREGENLVVSGTISTTLGPIEKRVIIPSAGVGLSFQYRLNWDKLPPAALRMGFITLHPLAFDRESLFFRTHNGGNSLETFFLNAQPIDHLAPASTLVSASQGMGATEGLVELGDSNRSIRIEFNPAQAALTGHILFRPSKDSYLFRLIFSAREIDDTSRTLKNCRPSLPEIFSFQLSVH